MAIKLPEKDYFTHDEIAQRWGCGRDLIDYYIEHGELREAVSTSKNFFALQVSHFYKCDMRSPEFINYDNARFLYDDLDGLLKSVGKKLNERDIVRCPEYVYIPNSVGMFESIAETENTASTYTSLQEGSKSGLISTYRINFLAGVGDRRYIPLTHENKNNETELDRWFFAVIDVKPDNFKNRIITRTERDRFEALYSEESDERSQDQQKNIDSPASSREANNRNRLIAIMLRLLTDKEQRRGFASQEALKDYLTDDVRKVPGLSKRNLDIIFAEANKFLKGEL